MTYGDGVSDVNITELIAFHKSHGKYATVTSVQPPGRFGAIQTKGKLVTAFAEKPEGDWIDKRRFFVLEPNALKYIDGDNTAWEGSPNATNPRTTTCHLNIMVFGVRWTL